MPSLKKSIFERLLTLLALANLADLQHVLPIIRQRVRELTPPERVLTARKRKGGRPRKIGLPSTPPANPASLASPTNGRHKKKSAEAVPASLPEQAPAGAQE